jgi:uroporphyrinogen III methyltransferase/synthase
VRVVFTRPAARGAPLAARLRAAGHEVAHVPLTAIEDAEPFPDPAPFDGVLFTSVNAVRRAPSRAVWPRTGAVGPATAAALAEHGVRVDVVGSGGGRALAEAWGPATGRRLLLPQAVGAHPALAEALRAQGADVSCVPVYRSVPLGKVDREPLAGADLICFFAPSQVRAFRDLNVETRARFWGHGPTTREAMAGLPQVQALPA